MSSPQSAVSDEAERYIECVRAGIARRSDLPLDLDQLVIEPILNWGGFVNRSLRVADASSEFVLKLASSPDARAGLERWRSVADVLASEYHAPSMIAWIELDECDGAGPLFDFVRGTTPDRLEQVPLPAIAETLDRLHADDRLAGTLADLGDPVTSCADAFRRSYYRRFIEDLDFIGAASIPFVDAEMMQWMRAEADGLEQRITRDAAFAEPADTPVHADLWLNNIIIGADAFWILDWDGLELGDLAMDWTMLLGPTRSGVRTHSPVNPETLAIDAAARTRLAAYQRAALLDWIIDPLADWVQSFDEPFHGETVRTSNERVHRDAVARYRELFAQADLP